MTIEKRYYFQNDRLIRRVVTKRPRAEDADPWERVDSEAELLDQAKVLRACSAAQSSEPAECTAPER